MRDALTEGVLFKGDFVLSFHCGTGAASLAWGRASLVCTCDQNDIEWLSTRETRQPLLAYLWYVVCCIGSIHLPTVLVLGLATAFNLTHFANFTSLTS